MDKNRGCKRQRGLQRVDDTSPPVTAQRNGVVVPGRPLLKQTRYHATNKSAPASHHRIAPTLPARKIVLAPLEHQQEHSTAGL